MDGAALLPKGRFVVTWAEYNPYSEGDPLSSGMLGTDSAVSFPTREDAQNAAFESAKEEIEIEIEEGEFEISHEYAIDEWIFRNNPYELKMRFASGRLVTYNILETRKEK